MPHDCWSFREEIRASNSSLARPALIEFLGCSLSLPLPLPPSSFNRAKRANCLPNGKFSPGPPPSALAPSPIFQKESFPGAQEAFQDDPPPSGKIET